MVFSWGGWFGFGMGFYPMYLFVAAVNYFLSRIYFVCISGIKCLLYLYPCGYCHTQGGLRKLEALQDFAHGFWHVCESRRPSEPVGCVSGGSHRLFQEVLLTLPRFSLYSCDESHIPGVPVLVDSGCNRVILFLIRTKLCHPHTHEKRSHAAGCTIPCSSSPAASPKDELSPQLSWIPRNLSRYSF